MTTRLKPRERNSRYDGPLTDFLARTPKEQHAAEEVRWYKAQMRAWALNWRERHVAAAILAKSPEEIGATDLYFAKLYREHLRKAGAL